MPETGLGGDDGLRIGRPAVYVSLALAPHSETRTPLPPSAAAATKMGRRIGDAPAARSLVQENELGQITTTENETKGPFAPQTGEDCRR